MITEMVMYLIFILSFLWAVHSAPKLRSELTTIGTLVAVLMLTAIVSTFFGALPAAAVELWMRGLLAVSAVGCAVIALIGDDLAEFS